MPNSGAYVLSDVTSATIEIVCDPCRRRGVLNTARMIAKYGADFSLPGLSRQIAREGGCKKVDDLLGIDGCMVSFGRRSISGVER